MKDLIDLLTQIITIDIFIGFGLFSILYVLTTSFKRDVKWLETLDSKSVRFISVAGVIYLFLILIWVIISLNGSDGPNTQGQFWWFPWLQPLIWILITQLFWIKKVKDIKIVRIVIAMLFIFSFEKYVIIVTSFHRDYIPSNWTTISPVTPLEIVFGLITKTTVFCLLATLYSFITDRLKLIVG